MIDSIKDTIPTGSITMVTIPLEEYYHLRKGSEALATTMELSFRIDAMQRHLDQLEAMVNELQTKH